MAGLWSATSDNKIAIGVGISVAVGAGLVAAVSYKMSTGSDDNDNVYETQKLLHEYLVFHYGSATDNLRFDFGPKDSVDFPKRCADLCLKHCKLDVSISIDN